MKVWYGLRWVMQKISRWYEDIDARSRCQKHVCLMKSHSNIFGVNVQSFSYISTLYLFVYFMPFGLVLIGCARICKCTVSHKICKLMSCFDVGISPLSMVLYGPFTHIPQDCFTDQCNKPHYSERIISAMVPQVPKVSFVCSTICSGADHIKHQSSTSLAFVRAIHRWASNMENIPIWWSHHVKDISQTFGTKPRQSVNLGIFVVTCCGKTQ